MDKILILDFGSQLTQLIARRIREANVYCELHRYDVSESFIRDFNPKGIILSGSPNSVYTNSHYRAPNIVFTLGVPVLGICYGMQTMANQLGGSVTPTKGREFGYAELQVITPSILFKDIEDRKNNQGNSILDVWMSHQDHVAVMPKGFTCIASSPACAIAAIADTTRHFYGLQFHPEVTHTRQGQTILNRFVHDICGAKAEWNMHDYIARAVAQIREQVGEDEVILGLSGGVDSSVTAALVHRAIKDQLTCVFVDHGLLRLNEAEQVMQTLGRHLGVKIIHVDASAAFIEKLAGVIDPEAKRKIIGHQFIEVFQAESVKIPRAKWLAQGTIYPDVIESGSMTAHSIKSHHNVGGLPDNLQFELLEPLRTLFKDEVRKLGIELGLPADMVYRHPFPGPGLGVRILGEVRSEYCDLLRQADAIFIEELHRTGWYDKVAQAFAVFLPIKSIGVMGDSRSYDYVIALRAVETSDFMTAKWAELPYALLAQVSTRIINEVNGINRVVYDISSKPPATVEWE